METYYWRKCGATEPSPFQLNMDTLQSSIFRLSMAELALQESSKARPR